MTEIIGTAYCSTPVGFSFKTIDDILKVSQGNNLQAGLTGALVYDNNNYLQWLEGDPLTVRAVVERIFQDDRHTDIKLLTAHKLKGRWFPDWNMTAAVTQGETLRGLKLVPHLSLAAFNPQDWSEADVVSFMSAFSDYLKQRPAPKSELLSENESRRPRRVDPLSHFDRRLRSIAPDALS
ncbi:BLUF domain-containing protein [Roseovarius sp. E0-M6]|uniref:BLUF domain-containing protein n=1 Tax=Roseovarius sp. E0-M6 TaxID=3127118 RepID=UPI0030104DF0